MNFIQWHNETYGPTFKCSPEEVFQHFLALFSLTEGNQEIELNQLKKRVAELEEYLKPLQGKYP